MRAVRWWGEMQEADIAMLGQQAAVEVGQARQRIRTLEMQLGMLNNEVESSREEERRARAAALEAQEVFRRNDADLRAELESLHARTPPCAVPRAPLVRMMGGFGYTGTTRPGKQSPRRVIPEEIPRPDYAVDGKPKARGPLFPWQIEVKSQKDIEGMRAAGRIAREVRGCEAPQP